MIFKTTPKKQILLIIFILLSIVVSTAQTNLPYFTNFESNAGGWTDGGNRSSFVTNNNNSPQGDNSWGLSDGNGSASTFYQNFNLSGYATVTISFSFQSNSFDPVIWFIPADSFEVKLDGTRVLFYTYNVDWDSNGEKNNVTITLSANDYTFNNDSEIRFESLASRQNDYVYFDEISVTGTNPVILPEADFTADNTAPFTDDIVSFTDLSDYTPTSWSWSFSGPGSVTYANGSSSSSQKPQVAFSTAGLYSVTLAATNAAGSNIETKTNYITVSAFGSDNPVSFTASTSTVNPYTFLDLSATANANGDNLLVAYNTANSFGTPTIDENNIISINGSGTVIFQGNANNINTNTLPQLNQSRTYYFKAWSINTAGFSRGITANASTSTVLQPDSFTATASAFSNNIAFTATANGLNDNLMLVYNTSDDFGIPQDGVLYQVDDNIGNATVLLSSVNAETINNYVHDLLLLNTSYYYRLYSVSNGIWYYSQGNKANDLTIDGFIWQNEITGDDTQDNIPYTRGQQVYPNITVSGVSLGAGLRLRDDDDQITADRISTNGTLDTANNDYFEFTLTPDIGYEINFDEFFYNGSDTAGDVEKAALRSSIDGFASNIGSVVKPDPGVTFDLTDANFQGIDEAITFRVYLWDASSDNVDFEIEDFGFKGVISQYAIWNGTSWSNTSGPNLATRAVLDGNYNTSIGGNQTSFRCKSLIINAGKTLVVDDETFVEVNFNTTVNGNIVVETKGAFVQRDKDGVFTVNGTSKVNKSTPFKDEWYYYTYWSSPIVDLDITSVFGDIWRKFYYSGSGWIRASSGAMIPGRGYIITAGSKGVQSVSFTGKFNTGTVTIPAVYDASKNENFNLIGNPYPSSIDLNQFLGANSSVLEGAAYFWSQETPPDGGEFSGSDYIPFNATGSVSTSSDSGSTFNGFVPSGQSFFIESKAAGNVSFTNAMRMSDTSSNSQFFKSSGVPPKGFDKDPNKLWINLTSGNGVFSQILIGYLEGATNEDDGLVYDATKFDENSGTFLYTTIENSNKKFVLQGKEAKSINSDEKIFVGLKTVMTDTFTISIEKSEGLFFSSNTIYLKDNLLGIIHDLSAKGYTFTSEVGEFNDRFEIVFSNESALSNETFTKKNNDLRIIELRNDYMEFSNTTNTPIKNVKIYNLLGQCILDLQASEPTEKYLFSNLSSAVYVSKVTLDNGIILTKKFMKK